MGLDDTEVLSLSPHQPGMEGQTTPCLICALSAFRFATFILITHQALAYVANYEQPDLAHLKMDISFALTKFLRHISDTYIARRDESIKKETPHGVRILVWANCEACGVFLKPIF